MELLGLIAAVAAVKEPCSLRIHSDSQYVLGAYEKRWLEVWRRNGWKTANKSPVQNRDLWEQLDTLLSHHEATFTWVKGHADDEENNRCDELAVAASKERATKIDTGYEADNPIKQNSGE